MTVILRLTIVQYVPEHAGRIEVTTHARNISFNCTHHLNDYIHVSLQQKIKQRSK